MKAYGYSVSKQAYKSFDGNKNERKLIRAKIRAYASLCDFELEGILFERDAHQFKKFNNRVKGKKLLSMVNDNCILITMKLADVFYSAEEMLNTIKLLKRHKIELHVIETGGQIILGDENELLPLLIKRFAEFEKHLRKSKGHKNDSDIPVRRGKIPFGFNKQGGELIENPFEQSIIRTMKEMHKNGNGYLSIAKEVGEKHNIMLSHMGVKKIIERNTDSIDK